MPDAATPDPLEYIRARYKVPARVGGRIRFLGTPHGGPVDGRIASACGPYLIVDLDPSHPAIAGLPGRYLLHPTRDVEYPDEAGARDDRPPRSPHV